MSTLADHSICLEAFLNVNKNEHADAEVPRPAARYAHRQPVYCLYMLFHLQAAKERLCEWVGITGALIGADVAAVPGLPDALSNIDIWYAAGTTADLEDESMQFEMHIPRKAGVPVHVRVVSDSDESGSDSDESGEY